MSIHHVFSKPAGWLANELGLRTMMHAGKDVYILIFARYLRLAAYGAVALILALYFQEQGFSDEQIGLFMTLTLLGDVFVSLLLTLMADSIGRRTTLLLGSLAMALSGAVFATTGNYIALLMAAIIGVISPSGNEIGPFRAVEESTLAQLVTEDKRSDVYTWYVVLAVLGTSTGLAVGGVAVDHLQAIEGWTDLDAYRTIFWIYTGVGLVKAIMILVLSRRCEHVDNRANQPKPVDETEPLLSGNDGLDGPETVEQSAAPAKPSKKPWISISTISKPSRGVLFKLCSLFFFDSLGSGMVPFSLINYFMQRKFELPQGKLGGIMSATWFVSTIGNVFAASLAKRIGLIQAMVATHLPSSIFLALLPVPPGLPLTICLLVGRSVLNSMDQAPRSVFLSLVVLPEERTAVMGVVNILKTLAQSTGPSVTGILAWQLSTTRKMGNGQQDVTKEEHTNGKNDWKKRAPYSIHEKDFKALYEASCHCGKVQYQLSREEPLDSKLCHCTTCQTQHAAPFQWAAIFHKEDINFKEGHHNLEWYDPSAKSVEHKLPCKVRCSFCHSPIMDEGKNMILLFPSLIHFPDNKTKLKFKPRCHMFYGQRVMDIPDGLPKWTGLDKSSELIEDSPPELVKEFERKREEERDHKKRKIEEEGKGANEGH